MIEGGAGEETPILVVDTGVAAKWYLNEDLGEEAARLPDAGERGEVRLVAPDPIAAEIFNVLWQHHMGHRGGVRSLSLEEAKSYWRELHQMYADLLAGSSGIHQTWLESFLVLTYEE